VFGQLRRRRRGRGGERRRFGTLSLEQHRRAVKISASVLTTDPWEEACQVLPNINTLTRNAAAQAYEQAGVGPKDLDLVELHDCFATAELVHYDNLMLCREGGAVDFFESGPPGAMAPPWAMSRAASNPRATPFAATGIANIWEVCHHLRGEAGDRQIENAKVGLPTSLASARPAVSTSWRKPRFEDANFLRLTVVP
jgi:acetyl-CoA acetyltransferase